jgi:hypothetical protein
MRKYVFLYKDNSEDRDCCAYIEAKPMRWECEHYFGSVNLNGACYCGHEFAKYENIKTILTETEYNQLIKFSEDIHNLGFGITKGDERYNRGIELCKSIQVIYDKLLSEEAQEFFEQIQEEEREYLMNEYSLDDDDIDLIFDNYYLDYRDRGVVGYVFKDAYDLGYEEAWALGYVSNNDSITSRYFDFEAFGEDLANEENYCELSDGRIVSLNY